MSWSGYIPGHLLNDPEFRDRMFASLDNSTTEGFVVTVNMEKVDSAPKLYTQQDIEEATAMARDELIQSNAEAARQLADLRTSFRLAKNGLFDFKQKAGLTLNEFFENEDIDEKVINLFNDLDLEDYIPKRSFLVEVSFSGTTMISVEAVSEEAAIEFVTNNTPGYEIKDCIDDYSIEWQTTGDVTLDN